MKQLYIFENGKYEEVDSFLLTQSSKVIKKISIIEAVDKYKVACTNKKSIKSQKNEKLYFKRFFDFCRLSGIENTGDINKIKSLEFLESLSHLSPATFNRHFNTYSNFFKFLFLHDNLRENFMVYAKRLKVSKTRKQLWSEQDIIYVKNRLDQNDLMLFSFLEYTGARSIEAVNLKWSDVDLSNGYMVFKSRKINGNSRRFPIGDTTQTLLKSINRASEHVFLTSRGTIYTSDLIFKKVKKVLDEKSLNSRLNIKGLRHTFATRLIRKGVPISDVQFLLGHGSISTTEHYFQENEISELKKHVD